MSTALTPTSARQKVGLEELRQLMRSVNDTTQQLEHTHAALSEQVARLQDELAEANSQLRRSRTLAALGEMAAGIAHEVRNPLGSIGLYVQMLAEDVADRPEPARLCQRIARAVEDLDAIVRDVLLFATEKTFQLQPTTAETLINKALESCRSLLAEAGVDVITAGGGPALDLEVDQGLIVQSLVNVIRNAVQAMAESDAARRELRIAAARQRRRGPDGRRAERIVIWVDDTGPGIAPEVLKRMFNPFFTTRRTGTGLGLAIVNRIVDAHGGQVTVSNRDGGGARVALCLPPRATVRSGTPTTPLTPSSPTAQAGSPQT